MSDSLLQQGIAAARAGNRDTARRILMTVVQQDPGNEQGWLWLSGVVDEPSRAAYCLQRVLALDPQNSHAQEGLRWVQSQLSPQDAAQSSAPGLPTLQLGEPPAAGAAAAHDVATPFSPRPQPEPYQAMPADPEPPPQQHVNDSLDDLRTLAGGAAAPEQRYAAQAPAALDSDEASHTMLLMMTPGEAVGYALLLGAVAGLNVVLLSAPERGVDSLGSGLLLALFGAFVFAFLLVPVWIAMVGVLLILARGALNRAEACGIAATGLLPGFLAAAAFLGGVARYLLPGFARPLELLQVALLAIAVVGIPVALYSELRHYPALRSGALPLLTGAATLVALLLGSLGILLGSAIL